MENVLTVHPRDLGVRFSIDPVEYRCLSRLSTAFETWRKSGLAPGPFWYWERTIHESRGGITSGS